MRSSRHTAVILAFFAWVGLCGTRPSSADVVHTDHVDAELIAENTALSKTSQNWLALRLKSEKDWHVYWRNPGDSGIATSLSWTLPEGVTAGDIEWPYPHRLSLGDIVNYGYSEETLHLVPLTLPSAWPTDQPVAMNAKAKWLVCKDICIPGSADLSLTLPVSDVPKRDEKWTAAFASARAALPQPAPADWKLAFAATDGDFTLGVSGAHISTGGDIEFFPYANDLLSHSAPPRVANDDKHGLRISQKLSDYFVKVPAQVEGVLVVHDGDSIKAWAIRAQPGTVPVVPLSAVKAETPPLAPPQPDKPLILVLALAVIGGLILNLMPCVFPLLSIKAISIIESRDKNRGRKIALAFAYTSGVILTFVGLAGLLLLLRGSGASIGWGFQLQQPAFIAGLAYLFFAMGLSLSGVVEFGARWIGVGQSLAAAGGARGAFFTGVLAVVVASPCTAPFMGAALGYALTQPAAVALLVFAFLGLGLALPLPVIGLIPAFGKLLPRPGPWMQTFKQVMAFPLYLTVVWLVWILGGLTDRNGMALALIGLTLIAFALWLWHRPGTVSGLFKVAAIAVAFALLAAPQIRNATSSSTPSTAAAEAGYEPWSADRLAQLRADKRTVFVNFTADWCITCKVNERVALASDSVHQAFAANDVVWLEGDWTRSDPAISNVLAQFGRSGVPLYLVYPKGGEPKVLPQILTPDIVLAALKP
jgi:thiol:disulfide interchange protein DsbD